MQSEGLGKWWQQGGSKLLPKEKPVKKIDLKMIPPKKGPTDVKSKGLFKAAGGYKKWRATNFGDYKDYKEETEMTNEITRDEIEAVDDGTEIETQSPEELFTLRDMIVAAASDKPDEFKSQFDTVMQDYIQQGVANKKLELQNTFLGVETQPEQEEGSENDGEETDGHSQESPTSQDSDA